MTQEEKKMLDEYHSGADAIRGFLFLCFVIGAIIGTIGAMWYFAN